MKHILSILFALIMLCACNHNDPIDLKLTNAERRQFGKAVEGAYSGQYKVLVYSHEGTSVDSVAGEMIVTDYSRQEMVMMQFPVAQLARLFDAESQIGQALAQQPARSIVLDYAFDYWWADGNRNSIQMVHHPHTCIISLPHAGSQIDVWVNLTTKSTVMSFTREQLTETAGAMRHQKRIPIYVEKISIPSATIWEDDDGWNHNEQVVLFNFCPDK